MKRPIYVSVYGHPSYKVTVYELNIITRPSTEEDNIDFELLDVKEDSSVLHDNVSLTEDNEKPAASIQVSCVPLRLANRKRYLFDDFIDDY